MRSGRDREMFSNLNARGLDDGDDDDHDDDNEDFKTFTFPLFHHFNFELDSVALKNYIS